QGREYIKEAEVAPHQEPGYKHAITPIMLKMACTIGGVHISEFTSCSFNCSPREAAPMFSAYAVEINLDLRHSLEGRSLPRDLLTAHRVKRLLRFGLCCRDKSRPTALAGRNEFTSRAFNCSPREAAPAFWLMLSR
ncbi:hypothetical protein, partial [Pseudoalteromonas sp. OF7H-1]|uniref:hypothetical protein n=1 Tax=Pseudoalteromonas sp. OF7H-1 TaxID=2917755 RepID=UPI001EF55A54